MGAPQPPLISAATALRPRPPSRMAAERVTSMPTTLDQYPAHRAPRLDIAEEKRRAREARRTDATLAAIHLSRWNASRCGNCGRAIAPTEPVWRWRTSWQNEWRRIVHGLVNLCQACRPDLLGWPPPFPCAFCSRQVYAYSRLVVVAGRLRDMTVGHRHRRFCSDLCAQRYRRGEPRSGLFLCAECRGVIAKPTRRRRFCSAACKQKEWRARRLVTAAGVEPRSPGSALLAVRLASSSV
jgi:hypothetical protein